MKTKEYYLALMKTFQRQQLNEIWLKLLEQKMFITSKLLLYLMFLLYDYLLFQLLITLKLK
jgi:hypothetical protein